VDVKEEQILQLKRENDARLQDAQDASYENDQVCTGGWGGWARKIVETFLVTKLMKKHEKLRENFWAWCVEYPGLSSLHSSFASKLLLFSIFKYVHFHILRSFSPTFVTKCLNLAQWPSLIKAAYFFAHTQFTAATWVVKLMRLKCWVMMTLLNRAQSNQTSWLSEAFRFFWEVYRFRHGRFFCSWSNHWSVNSTSKRKSFPEKTKWSNYSMSN